MTMTKEDQGVQLADVGVEVEEQPFDEVLWKQRGSDLVDEVKKYVKAAEAHEVTQWGIGDWLLQGEDGLGEFKMYEEAERITGFERNYLYTVVWVVKRFPPSLRKENALRWSHFKELARIPDEQIREQVLVRVGDGFDHSVRDVRLLVDQELKKLEQQKRSGKQPRPQKEVYLRVPLSLDEHKQVKQLAKAEGKRPETLLQGIVRSYLVAHKDEISAKVEKPKESRRSQRKGRPQ